MSCLPEHFRAGAQRIVSPKDPRAPTLNARLAAAVAKVARAELPAAAHKEAFVPAVKPRRVPAEVPRPAWAQQFYDLWLADNPGLGASSNRRFKQVVAHLEAYRAGATLTRKGLLDTRVPLLSQMAAI